MAGQDSEVAAMATVLGCLEGLGRGARARVLKWAEERLVREPLPELDAAHLTSFVNALGEAAKTMGDIRPLDIVVAAEEIGQLRAEREASAGTDG